MKRLGILCAAAVITYTLATITTNPARAQGDSAPNSYVKLQPATPGAQQAGNTNISGTAIAGQILANGVGTAFGVEGQDDAATGIGVFGYASGTTGANSGVYAQTDSSPGTSLTAINTARGKTVELTGPKGAVWTDGHYYRQYATSERHAVDPIANGTVNANATIAGGTGNITVAHVSTGVYDITIDGESYNPANCTIVITLTSTILAIPTVIDFGTAARVYMRTPTPTFVDSSFNFVVYKTNPSN
jgi:hypothetical protein